MSKRVLIVDDGAFMRLLIKQILTKHDYTVVGEAENGEQAIEMYMTLKPDLVTMDITMPVMDGLTAVKGIIEKDPDATIVMVSAMGQEPYIRQAIKSGAKSFIVKPFDEDMLMDIIQSV